MASIFTHYYFGQEVLARLPKQYRDMIHKYINFYDLGQQGPDFFYFYKPTTSKGSKIGSEIHQGTAEDFIFRNKSLLCNASPELLSYIYGFICHFTLDLCVHPYVNNLEMELKLSHMEIETELDRYYMIKENWVPNDFETFKLIPTHPIISEIITPLYSSYGNVDQDMVQDAIKDFVKYKKLLHSSSKRKETFLFFFMKRLGVYNKYKGQIMKQAPDKRAHTSNEILSKRLYEAIPLAVQLIDGLNNYLQNGGRLSHYFKYNFSGVQQVST